jgi:hypothetical protein
VPRVSHQLPQSRMAGLREPSISVSRSPSQDGTHSIPPCVKDARPAPRDAGLFLAQVRAPGAAVTCVTPIPSSRRVSVMAFCRRGATEGDGEAVFSSG